jgi:hypothetical protein
MKTFLSWSGEKSRMFGESFKPWLEQVLPGNDVWLSSEDIDKGTIWFTEIVGELEKCNCGIILITRENRNAPWIHFEAGGMVKGLGKSRVATVLLDLDYSELSPPLNQFNGTRVNRQGAWHLVKSLNRLAGDRAIKDRVLEKTFDKFWQELDDEYRMQFPDSHREAAAEPKPVYIAPPPAAVDIPLLGTLAKTGKKKNSGYGEQPGLFNGIKE